MATSDGGGIRSSSKGQHGIGLDPAQAMAMGMPFLADATESAGVGEAAEGWRRP